MQKQPSERDYLWDGRGEPDPEVRALEDALRPLRHQPRALEHAVLNRVQRRVPPHRVAGAWRWMLLAALVLLGVGVWIGQREPEALVPVSAERAWRFERALGDASAQTSWLAVGQWITTAAGERAQLQVADIGTLDIAPDTQLRIRSTGPTAHRLELNYGMVHALVDAPPRLLIIESALGEVVDLGCEYVLALDREGRGYVHVHQGAVVIERAGRLPLFLAAGVRVESTAARGLGLPFFDDADRALILATRERAELMRETDFIRPHDSLTLWYLLEQTAQTDIRRQLIGRLFELVPGLQEAVSEEDLVAPTAQSLASAQRRLESFWLSL